MDDYAQMIMQNDVQNNEPFKLKANDITRKKVELRKKKKFIRNAIILGIAFISFIFIIWLTLTIKSNKDGKEKENIIQSSDENIIQENKEEAYNEGTNNKNETLPIEVYGSIICSYNIKEGEINILSDEFEKIKNLIIYINEKKINFTKTYKFELNDSKRLRFDIISKKF